METDTTMTTEGELTALTAATNHIAAKLIESRGTGMNRIQQEVEGLEELVRGLSANDRENLIRWAAGLARDRRAGGGETNEAESHLYRVATRLEASLPPLRGGAR